MMGENTEMIIIVVLDKPLFELLLSSSPPPPFYPPLVAITVDVTCMPATVPESATCKLFC